MNSGFTLYRLYNAAAELIYIGKSIHRYRRLDQHCRNQPWAAEIANASFQEFADEAALSAAEIAAIQCECPKYNVVHAKITQQRVSPIDDTALSRIDAARALSVECIGDAASDEEGAEIVLQMAVRCDEMCGADELQASNGYLLMRDCGISDRVMFAIDCLRRAPRVKH